MTKILALGSAGQIGTHLVDLVNDPNNGIYSFEVVEYDIQYGPDQDLREWTPEFSDLVADCDVILFLAFDVGGSTYLEKYQHSFDFINNNLSMMYNVFNEAERHDTPVIFASSQMASMSWSPYGILKNIGELYTKSLGGLVVKFWNVYGIEREEEKFHVITDFILMALKDGVIQMRTDGNEERQFLFADDCSRALLTLSDSVRRGGHAQHKEYHITSHEWTTILKLANIVADVVGGVRVVRGEKSDTVQGVKNPADPYIINAGLWEPSTSLREGIEEMVEYYRRDNGL